MNTDIKLQQLASLTFTVKYATFYIINQMGVEYVTDKYIDLHIHLDGAITPSIARKLANIQNIALPSCDSELERMLTAPDNCKSLNDFLSCFALPLSLMQTYDSLKEAAFSVAEDLKSKGVIYTEIRFAPQLHTKGGMTQEDAVKAVLEGIFDSTLKSNIILCCMRGNDNKNENLETVALAEKYLVSDGGVVAIDLAGAEALYPTESFADLFKRAHDSGIPFTIHAGEADGVQSIAKAIEFGAKRIGHGVRATADKSLMQTLANMGITLEMCPTSNRLTQAVADMSKYPLTDFLKIGIKVTIGTDDPAIENTDIAKEYSYIEKAFGITKEQKANILKNSVNAAFTTDTVKEALIKELNI